MNGLYRGDIGDNGKENGNYNKGIEYGVYEDLVFQIRVPLNRISSSKISTSKPKVKTRRRPPFRKGLGYITPIYYSSFDSILFSIIPIYGLYRGDIGDNGKDNGDYNNG